MKKYILLIAVLLISAGLYAQNNNSKSDNSKEGWLHYSLGLSYKNSAFEKSNPKEQRALLDKALEHFLKAAEDNDSLDIIYTQIGDTYLILNNLNSAISYFSKAIDYNNAHAEAYFKLYESYMRKNDLKNAAATLESYRKVNPNDVLNLFILGEHYYKLANVDASNIDLSQNCFEALLSVSHSDVGNEIYREYANYYLGNIAYFKSKFFDSIKYFENVLSINNHNTRAKYMLMLLYYDVCNFSEAVNYANQYLELVKDDSVACSVIGRVRYITGKSGYMSYLRKGSQAQKLSNSKTQKNLENLICEGLLMAINEEEGAEPFLVQLGKAKNNDIAIRVALSNIFKKRDDKPAAALELTIAGMLAFDSRNYNLADRFFREAIVLDDSMDENMPEIYYYLGVISEEAGLIAPALHYYQKLYKIKPSNELAIHIGYLHILRKQYDKALTSLRPVLKNDPKNPKVHFMVGICYYEKKQYKEADKYLIQAIELDHENETYYLYLAKIKEKDKNIAELVRVLEVAIELFPESPDVNNFLGYIYVDYSLNLDKGLELIEKALAADPTNGAYLDSLGWAYYRKGDYPRALEKLLEAERSDIKDPVIYDHLGDAYFKLGDKKQAVNNWKKALEFEKNSKIQRKIDEVKIDKDDNNDKK